MSKSTATSSFVKDRHNVLYSSPYVQKHAVYPNVFTIAVHAIISEVTHTHTHTHNTKTLIDVRNKNRAYLAYN